MQDSWIELFPKAQKVYKQCSPGICPCWSSSPMTLVSSLIIISEQIQRAALSVIFSRYKHNSICAKVAHIVYEPILAEIYLLAAYSALAQKYHVCYMRVGQHIFCLALCIPANIYAGMLLVIQPTYI